jgi:catechol 2,3-dioxygenase-like lactoylglutathione lyase family enzyme
VTRLHHLAVGSGDVERLAAFYRELFEMPEAARHHDEHGKLRSIWLELGDGWLMLEHSSEPPHIVRGVGSGPFLFALGVSAAERSRLERALEERGQGIESRTAFTSYARDPDGNRIAFSHYPEPDTFSHEP